MGGANKHSGGRKFLNLTLGNIFVNSLSKSGRNEKIKLVYGPSYFNDSMKVLLHKHNDRVAHKLGIDTFSLRVFSGMPIRRFSKFGFSPRTKNLSFPAVSVQLTGSRSHRSAHLDRLMGAPKVSILDADCGISQASPCMGQAALSDLTTQPEVNRP